MERDVVKLINLISKKVLSITEKEFLQLEGIAKSQLEYHDSSKLSLTIKQHKLGIRNLKLINGLRELQKSLKITNKKEI